LDKRVIANRACGFGDQAAVPIGGIEPVTNFHFAWQFRVMQKAAITQHALFAAENDGKLRRQPALVPCEEFLQECVCLRERAHTRLLAEIPRMGRRRVAFAICRRSPRQREHAGLLRLSASRGTARRSGNWLPARSRLLEPRLDHRSRTRGSRLRVYRAKTATRNFAHSSR